VPRFGGVSILNPPIQLVDNTSSSATPRRMNLDANALKPVMEVFAAQMRGLLGVKQVWMSDDDRLSDLLVREDIYWLGEREKRS
jgi:hypothetical protein